MKDGVGIKIKNLTVNYKDKEAVRNVSLSIPLKQVTAIIGPSGCGKSTLLRAINRMNDFIPNCTTKGEVIINGENIYSENISPTLLRKYVGMVFQKPNPFPKSIFANVSWAIQLHKLAKNKQELYEMTKNSLKQAALWEEVGDRLYDSALSLSGGQQQRLCIARALAIKPKILLMDEPCSALDPKSTYRIEELIEEIKEEYTIVIVTHNMQQAARVADYTAFLYNGELIEVDKTEEIFKKPKDKRTEDYITGRFG